jgi:hypothetical protein
MMREQRRQSDPNHADHEGHGNEPKERSQFDETGGRIAMITAVCVPIVA